MTDGNFKDHFSTQAAIYTQFRPHYPREIFAWLASQVSSHYTAWDCATGNGQAAAGLADYFSRVIATDASASQIDKAPQFSTIEFRVASAEKSGLANASVDLVTVAQAAHWFDHEAFAAEVQRVLRPEGVIALWCYELQSVTPEIDAVIHKLYDDILDGYWPPERRHIETGYREIPFPFEEITPPAFILNTQWRVEQELGYMRSWSSAAHYLNKHHSDPVSLIENGIAPRLGRTDPHRAMAAHLQSREDKLRQTVIQFSLLEKQQK